MAIMLAALMVLALLGCSQDQKMGENVYPLPMNHPDAQVNVDLSQFPEMKAPENGTSGLVPDSELQIVTYDVSSSDVQVAEMSASRAVGSNVVEGYIPSYLSMDRTVIGTDNRFKITATTSYPYSTYVKMYMTFPNGLRYIGSGTLVGDKHVLTAGHCIYSAGDGGWATSITVYPGLAGSYAPFGSTYATYLRSVTQWTGSTNYDYDYGIITLASNIGQAAGWHGYAYFSSGTSGLAMGVYGYPADRDSGLYQYGAYDYVRTYTTNRLYYYADTYGGQSGGAVISRGSTYNDYLFGIHSGSNYVGSTLYNRATRMTSGIFNHIASAKAAD